MECNHIKKLNKMKKILLTTVLFVSFGISHSNAQFFKKLTERALEKTSEAVINKATDKVASKAEDKTSDAMDKLLNPDIRALMSPTGKKVDMSKLPNSYDFDYRYALKITTNDGVIDFDYYLNKNKPYMGAKMNMGQDMMMVFDEGNKAMVTTVGGMTMATEMDFSNAASKEDADMYNNYTFKTLPNKQFLGHDCIGREMENDKYKFIVYIAPDMEANFNNMFKSEHANLPPAMQKFADENKNGVMMYMEMLDKANKKKKNSNVTMECVAFEPTNFVINTRQ